MSTNSECAFIEVSTGKWYYLLENYRGDDEENYGDWRESASSYGPFPNFDAAYKHLHDNHANPGGFWTQALGENEISLDLSKDPVLKRLINEASPPVNRNSYRSRGW